MGQGAHTWLRNWIETRNEKVELHVKRGDRRRQLLRIVMVTFEEGTLAGSGAVAGQNIEVANEKIIVSLFWRAVRPKLTRYTFVAFFQLLAC